MYCDYYYYKGKFPQSEITASQFDLLGTKASKEIDNVITGTVTVTDDVKMCCCELINYLYSAENSGATAYGVNSESVGDYSVSYADKSSQAIIDKRKKRDIINFWLGKQMTYRGVSRRVL